MIIDELFESPQQCPECGGISFSDLILAEKKDACYHKVKASAKVWPSAYASGRLVQCRKKGAANYGNKSEGVAEGSGESYIIVRTDSEGKKDVFAGNFDTYEQAQKELDDCLAHPLHTKYKQKFEIKRKGGEQGVAEGSDAEAYKQKLLSSLPQMMRFYEKNVQGWKPSEEQMLAAVETGYTVMKHTGDVKQAGKAVMDELNTLHRMSQGQQGVAEGVMYGAENLTVGDDVIISGDVEFNGATGVIDRFGQDKRFVVVDLYNHGPHSFHSSDVSANDYDNDEHDDLDEATPTGTRLNLSPITSAELGSGSQVPQFRLPIIPDNMPGGRGMPGGAGNLARNIATQRSVGGKAIPSLGQPGKVVTSPTMDKILTKLGGKNVEIVPGPTSKPASTNVRIDPAADVPAYIRKGLPDPVTTPVGKPKISVKPGETMDQAVTRTQAEKEFSDFLKGKGKLSFGAGAGPGGQGGPTAAQATSGSNQVPTIKLPNGQIVPDSARLSPSGQYNTQSGSNTEMDKIMKKWDQENNPAKSKGHRPWGSAISDQPGWTGPQRKETKPSMLSKLIGGGSDIDEETSRKKQPPEVEYDDEYDAMVARVKKLAGLGPMKTVYDPTKRVYRNMPTAQQPKK